MTTFVLIHGAYQGGWIWKLVAMRLRDGGHLVYAPTLDGCGERAAQLRPGITTETQAEEVAGFLWSEDIRDVVLVRASAGGMVMAKTAELARERISRLVFSDALALMDGEKSATSYRALAQLRPISPLARPARSGCHGFFSISMAASPNGRPTDPAFTRLRSSTSPWCLRISGIRTGTRRSFTAVRPTGPARCISDAPRKRLAPAGTSSKRVISQC